MSLFQEIAAHGLAYCAYNNALTNSEQLSDIQKLTLAQALISDLYNDYGASWKNSAIINALSCADSCIIEALVFIERGAA